MTPSPEPQRPTARESADGQSDAYAELLQGSIIPTSVVAVVCVVVALFSGVKAGWSAAFGAFLVIAFFTVSLVVMKRTAHLAPTTVMAIVMVTYTAKVLALGLAMFLLRDASWVNGYAVGVTITICTLVWLFFEMRAYKRLRIFAFDPRANGADSDTPQSGQHA
ncbi:MAG TPA: hypothetical protein PKC73_03560 [Dermatophilaceae bacterium]|jgi:hypothetical protein|nr:hypothetical protein [Actinomycetales bacterium]HMT33356.1 hypothetical protein [Dermatophilaceae bacterium]HMT88694.1 hypothetical protein [Dermatophilaceae bacterium]